MFRWLRGHRTLGGALVALVLLTWLGGYCLHCAALAAPPPTAAAGPCHGHGGGPDPGPPSDGCPCDHAAAIASVTPEAVLPPATADVVQVFAFAPLAPRHAAHARIAPWPPPPTRALLHPHMRYPRRLT